MGRRDWGRGAGGGVFNMRHKSRKDVCKRVRDRERKIRTVRRKESKR